MYEVVIDEDGSWEVVFDGSYDACIAYMLFNDSDGEMYLLKDGVEQELDWDAR